MDVSEKRSTEIREEIIEENLPGDGDYIAPVERHEHVRVVRGPNGDEYSERVIEDVGAERASILSRVAQLVWLATGLLELMIALRIFLKLIAANPSNPFAQLVYGITELFVWPFLGLTVTPSTSTGMVLEISSFIALLVYPVAAWAFIKLMYLIFTPSGSRSVTVYQRDRR
ncbi:MAG: YggT family protein [Chloroflexi bacterium]|nr:YggT family protein [Chloroflexota bacterium]MCI0577024.1 YggT family protein [Chloroflexota bacterium]MCI0648820.1 YggT family protein [Chloroflexota bacterium]MCI0726322.1 YggT family protein [Chloroflexota bacterium]